MPLSFWCYMQKQILYAISLMQQARMIKYPYYKKAVCQVLINYEYKCHYTNYNLSDCKHKSNLCIHNPPLKQTRVNEHSISHNS